MSATKRIIIIMFAFLLLIGCSESWQADPTFTFDNRQVFGKEGIFAIEKSNGINAEPAFPVGSGGRLYHLYFLDEDFSGQRFKLTATQENSEEIITFYKWNIENNQSGTKFGFEQEGLWKIQVLVDDNFYTEFIIEAK